MKKLILGSSLVVLALGGVIYMAQGESLKASDEITMSESSQTSVETTQASIVEDTVEPTTPADNSQLQDSPDFPSEVVEAPAEPEQLVSQSSDESTTKPSSSSSAAENTTEPSSSFSSTESTTEPSSSSSSVTESTTRPSSSSSSTESTTKPSSSSSSATESTTKPSNSSNSTESTTKPGSGSFSTTESTTKPNQESGKNEPATVPSVRQPNIVPYPSQRSVSTNYSPLPTIGNTNPLGEHEVTLDEDLKVSQVAESDLNGYELPLLSSFGNENQGLLVYEGLRKLGEKEETYTNEQLLSEMYLQLFDQEFTAMESQSIDHLEGLQPGDTLLVKNKPIGMYLGEDHYLTVKKEKSKENDETENSVKVALLSERKSGETIIGKRTDNFTKTTYGKEILSTYPSNIKIDISENTQQFIDQIGKDAQKLGLKYDVFASVMIAQAILESGSGSSGLSSAPNYNLFGVKGSYEGQSVNLATQEDNGSGELYTISAAFRKYPSYAESLGDYVTLIREGISGNSEYYQEAWRSEAKNYLRAAQSLTGKYATDTLYHHKISSIISAYHLTKYDEKLPAEGAATSVVLQSKDSIPEAYRKKMTFPDYDGKNYNLSGSYPVGQCTWYAYNRVAQLGGHVDDYMGNGGEWVMKGRSLGYEVTQTPKAGYLISFSPGTAGSDARYGHVAFVEAVTDQGILISEGNVVGGTVISYRVIPNDLAKSQLVSYIRPQ
ncbi:glucosaminidase domain-containing protein [Enterococcus sp. AZ072]|uniref:glucosaminidase domain-containing protein n=1 Tax=unclassified Enterococcus TaxID=2608891 RepID=UPI003D28A0CC